MAEYRLFHATRSFKGNKSKATGKYIARTLRQQAHKNKLWASSEHPENRQPHAWEYSVYYWWWEFMRRHKGYRECCERGGKGKYAKLYADWGDIHASEYWNWWNQKVVDDANDTWTRGEYLFAEPLRSIQIIRNNTIPRNTQSSLNISVPLEVGKTDLMRMFRGLLTEHAEQVKQARNHSNALYPVHTKFVIRELFWSLRAWDIELETQGQKPKVKNHEKARLMGLSVDLKSDFGKQRARMDFKRYFKSAENYIYFAVEEGTFPKKK